jgi:hypothetical protein
VRERRYVDDPNDNRPAEAYSAGSPATALLKASRELRVAAVPLLPKLIEAIEREAHTIIDRVEQSKKIADSLK